MTEELKKKVDRAIRLLQSIPTDKGDIELSYSGGKDSDVILELAKMAKIPFRAIYKSTGIDPPYTIKHVLDNGGEVIRPREPFIKLLRRKGFPSRFTRFCCGALKEYKVLDIAIHGIRRSDVYLYADFSRTDVWLCYATKKGEYILCLVMAQTFTMAVEEMTRRVKELGLNETEILFDERRSQK